MDPSRTYHLTDPAAVATQLATRVRELRLLHGWKQATLAERSGVTLGSLRRFEQTGRISLRNLLRIVLVLGRLDEFAQLLAPPEATSLAELEERVSRPKRKRGRQ